MSEHEDPAQQEMERLARGEAPGLASNDTLASGDEPLEAEAANSESAATGDQEDTTSQTSGDETPGYQ